MRPTDPRRGFLLPVLALLLFAAVVPPAPAAEPAKSIEYVDGVPDTGQFLPNSDILAKVADREISVYDFRDAYFLSDATIRPRGDSLGRAEFLTNMIRKEVLGLAALSGDHRLGFEQRSALREYQRTLISNRFYELAVRDVPEVPEDSLRKVFDYMCVELRPRVLTYPERAEAEAASAALASGRSTFDALLAGLNPGAAKKKPGEIPWLSFQQAPLELALQIWHLQPGQVSEVLGAPEGYQIYQVLEQRPFRMPEYSIMRPIIRSSLRDLASGVRRLEMLREAKRGMTIHYDTTTVKWASRKFFATIQSDTSGKGGGVIIDERLPEFAPEDTSRTVLSWDAGRISLGRLAYAHASIASVMRPSLNTPEALMDFADALMLEPKLHEMALARGLDKDPVVVQLYQRRLESILVERMVEDSCFSRIFVTPKERRDFYQRNRNRFVTYPSVLAAFVVRDTRAGADSVMARISAGESVTAIVHADSLRGELRSHLRQVSTQDRLSIEKVLFEEMRPGQSRVMGPDNSGAWACVHLVDFNPGDQLPFERVETVVDESLRNIKAETALNDFVDRLRVRYPIVSHYEKLPRVKLTVPAQEEHD
jgi:hypothetical protein